MDITLRKNTTDGTMIDLVTLGANGKEILWTVVHCDLLYGVGGALEEIFNANGEVAAQIDVKL